MFKKAKQGFELLRCLAFYEQHKDTLRTFFPNDPLVKDIGQKTIAGHASAYAGLCNLEWLARCLSNELGQTKGELLPMLYDSPQFRQLLVELKTEVSEDKAGDKIDKLLNVAAGIKKRELPTILQRQEADRVLSEQRKANTKQQELKERKQRFIDLVRIGLEHKPKRGDNYGFQVDLFEDDDVGRHEFTFAEDRYEAESGGPFRPRTVYLVNQGCFEDQVFRGILELLNDGDHPLCRLATLVGDGDAQDTEYVTDLIPSPCDLALNPNLDWAEPYFDYIDEEDCLHYETASFLEKDLELWAFNSLRVTFLRHEPLFASHANDVLTSNRDYLSRDIFRNKGTLYRNTDLERPRNLNYETTSTAVDFQNKVVSFNYRMLLSLLTNMVRAEIESRLGELIEAIDGWLSKERLASEEIMESVSWQLRMLEGDLKKKHPTASAIEQLMPEWKKIVPKHLVDVLETLDTNLFMALRERMRFSESSEQMSEKLLQVRALIERCLGESEVLDRLRTKAGWDLPAESELNRMRREAEAKLSYAQRKLEEAEEYRREIEEQLELAYGDESEEAIGVIESKNGTANRDEFLRRLDSTHRALRQFNVDKEGAMEQFDSLRQEFASALSKEDERLIEQLIEEF